MFYSRKEIIDSIEIIDPIPEDLENRIMDEGIIFGSSVFGGYDKDHSDIDVLLLNDDEDLNFYDMIVEGFGLYVFADYSEEEFRSIYVRNKTNQVYNLMFFYKREDLKVWIKATQIMKEVVKSSKYIRNLARKSKESRVEIFEFLKHIQRVECPDDLSF